MADRALDATNPRLALMSRLNTPPYDGPSGTYCTPLDEAAQLLDAYRATVLLEAANALAAVGPVDSLVSGPRAWTEAIETLRRIADDAAGAEASDG